MKKTKMAEALEQAQRDKDLREFKKALEEAETNYRENCDSDSESEITISESTTDEEE